MLATVTTTTMTMMMMTTTQRRNQEICLLVVRSRVWLCKIPRRTVMILGRWSTISLRRLERTFILPRQNRTVLIFSRNAARPGGASPGEPSSSAPPSRFRGSGQTLGGDDTPSQVIPDPHANSAPAEGPVQVRVLHLWEDGFSVEDGPLRRFDDPANATDLSMIRSGRAPLHLMGVNVDQPVDVQLVKHDENYKALPKKYKPFSGSGNRLGSPTPGASSSTAAPAAASQPSASTAPVEPVIDASQPTVALRLQLANGTRLPARFNTTSTIGDVYTFVNQAAPGSSERPWVLATTFPNKDHTDKSLVLGEMPEFKRGGTAVQKWT